MTAKENSIGNFPYIYGSRKIVRNSRLSCKRKTGVLVKGNAMYVSVQFPGTVNFSDLYIYV